MLQCTAASASEQLPAASDALFQACFHYPTLCSRLRNTSTFSFARLRSPSAAESNLSPPPHYHHVGGSPRPSVCATKASTGKARQGRDCH
ncbi:hypothetical protein VFPFJ_03176 [Purpureocillium lilacinum]|uniref:Uncharacterized protein n=1 Tax=Purpureocillium lilacinum TaxID=33203 RepID=A0A179GU08_PURLI|nr:hypothetical protein VFPFJ_03176 [Purpureocillium lilacinum]OAQ81384.1 hypothetical protein VFPBJ_03968 [Purpureocillium lilacinum]OAQ91436.1 hypothetical protein VFPFJ_03176 [Purpureocillium lilacinum]